MSTYKTIENTSTSEYKEKRSKFLGYAFPCQSLERAERLLDEVRSQHPKASHYCYAYVLGDEGETERTWDDGEPSGTAGLPILYQIKSHELTYVLVVVVRYYGGKQLGASGLKNAYKLAAKECLDQNQAIEKEPMTCISLVSDYEQMPEIMNTLKRYQVDVEDQVIDTACEWKIWIPKKDEDNFKADISKISTFTTC